MQAKSRNDLRADSIQYGKVEQPKNEPPGNTSPIGKRYRGRREKE